MDTFEQAALKLKKFLFEKRPLEAKPSDEAIENDKNLAMSMEKGIYRMFDGVIYWPKTGEVFCSFYDEQRKSAVLVPAIDLVFKDQTIQKRVKTFIKQYYSH